MKIKTLLKFDKKFLYFIDENICSVKISWDIVSEVFAFKRDLFTVDEICIGFRINDEGEYYEINEEMENYTELINFLNIPFAGIKQNWFTDVAHPAFETNLVSLWGNKKIENIWNK